MLYTYNRWFLTTDIKLYDKSFDTYEIHRKISYHYAVNYHSCEDFLPTFVKIITIKIPLLYSKRNWIIHIIPIYQR